VGRSQPDRARYVFNWRELEVIDRREWALAALNEQLYRVAPEWLAEHVRAGRYGLGLSCDRVLCLCPYRLGGTEPRPEPNGDSGSALGGLEGAAW
jgi:hypothetical protein